MLIFSVNNNDIFLSIKHVNFKYIWPNFRPPGQEIREDNCDDTGNVRYDDFYVSHNSDNVSDISPQYSLFEENTDDVTDEVDAPIVLYGQHIDGRVSTFVHTRKPTGENNVLYINDHDNNTPL